MTDEAEARRASLILGGGLALLALAAAALAVDGARDLLGAWGGARVVLRTGAVAALPAAVMLGAFAAMLLRGRPNREPTSGDARLFRLALWAAPFLVLLPLGAWLAADAALTGRGYSRCLSEPGARFVAPVWARSPAACAAAGASSPSTVRTSAR